MNRWIVGLYDGERFFPNPDWTYRWVGSAFLRMWWADLHRTDDEKTSGCVYSFHRR